MNEPGGSPARWKANDRTAIQALDALRGPELPWSEWSMRPAALATIVEEIARSDLRHIVELGSGASTVVLARAARDHGARLVSVEHDPAWAAAIRDLLRGERLEGVAGLIDAPLTEEGWYDRALVGAACPERIDLLVVDGPPAGSSLDPVRAPAVPELEDLLAPDCTVVLDDITRPAEREAAGRWRRTLGCELELDESREIAVLRREPG